MTMKHADQPVTIMDPGIRVCVWTRSSTDPITGKMELPVSCQKKGCTGVFHNNIFPICEEFMEPKTSKNRDRILASIGRK